MKDSPITDDGATLDFAVASIDCVFDVSIEPGDRFVGTVKHREDLIDLIHDILDAGPVAFHVTPRVLLSP